MIFNGCGMPRGAPDVVVELSWSARIVSRVPVVARGSGRVSLFCKSRKYRFLTISFVVLSIHDFRVDGGGGVAVGGKERKREWFSMEL